MSMAESRVRNAWRQALGRGRASTVAMTMMTIMTMKMMAIVAMDGRAGGDGRENVR